ncbi:MAG: DUF262 domain-containing protein [Methyloglobulus sp.]|nr:DUF262 domain-containing protein [Methyloglobulus sp.]
MSATNFKTENNIFRKLIGNGLTYKIPHFQRDYSWTESEWDDLWQDILGTIDGGEPAHYMGYLVLQSDDEKTFEVIDGQQRLTTLTLIILAVLKNLQDLINNKDNPDQNQRRLDQIRQSYIGYLDPVTLVSKPKLTLNRNNNDYFQTYIIPLGHLPQRGFKASEHSLRKAFEWFYKRVQDYLKKINGDLGKALAQLVEDISDKLFFTVITVTDELNAYKVFETLNARGVKLSSTDLLKNYLFSVLHKENQHEHELKILEDRWENMVGRLGSESFPDFLRIHWNSRHTFVRQSDLFKTIRRRVNNRESVFSLLRDMEQDIDTYIALTQPEISEWTAALKDYVRKLKMFSVRQPFPLILAAARMLNNSDLEILMRSCVIISFRYNVIAKQQSNEQERVYTSVAQKAFKGELISLHQILISLKPIYLEDEAFFYSFTDKCFDTRNSRNARIVRYILCQLEKQESNQDYDFESNTFNIEHILPQKTDASWRNFSDADLEAMTYRLGNMALLEKNKNQQADNSDFQIKRPILSSSGFKTTQNITEENESWSPERIETRQKKMAKSAKTIWRIAQLS